MPSVPIIGRNLQNGLSPLLSFVNFGMASKASFRLRCVQFAASKALRFCAQGIFPTPVIALAAWIPTARRGHYWVLGI